jgi:hypothetical protein
MERLDQLVRLLLEARDKPPELYGASADAFAKVLVKQGGVLTDAAQRTGEWPPSDPAQLETLRHATTEAFKAWKGGFLKGEWEGSAYLRRVFSDGRPPWQDSQTGLVSRSFADAATIQWATARTWKKNLPKKGTAPTGWSDR